MGTITTCPACEAEVDGEAVVVVPLEEWREVRDFVRALRDDLMPRLVGFSETIQQGGIGGIMQMLRGGNGD